MEINFIFCFDEGITAEQASEWLQSVFPIDIDADTVRLLRDMPGTKYRLPIHKIYTDNLNTDDTPRQP
jgi:hypothetical protein